MYLTKKELRLLAESMGVELHTEGSAWVAVFPNESITFPGQKVTFRGTRQYIGDVLSDIKKTKDRRANTRA